MEPYSPVDGFFLYVDAYDDNRLLRVRCYQRSDSDHFAKAIAAELERLNVKPFFKDAGTLDEFNIVSQLVDAVSLSCCLKE